MNFKGIGIDADHPQTQRNYFFFVKDNLKPPVFESCYFFLQERGGRRVRLEEKETKLKEYHNTTTPQLICLFTNLPDTWYCLFASVVLCYIANLSPPAKYSQKYLTQIKGED